MPDLESTRPKAAAAVAPRVPPRAGTRPAAVLIVDIAGTVALRAQLGEAAAERRIRSLLQSIIDTAEAYGGAFIKSYGDDVMAIFEREAVASAAGVAVEAQRLARRAGLQLYAGFDHGDVEFRETMGHPDAVGLTVSIAARLHKLTDGVPGRIFFAEELLPALPVAMQSRAARFGARELKGLGHRQIWTLDWQDDAPTHGTVLVGGDDPLAPTAPLLLQIQGATTRLGPRQRACLIGRGKDCAIRVLDPEARISSSHLLLDFAEGHWFAQDISRNGTWLRDDRSDDEVVLPHCRQSMLPKSGRLSLGRPFAQDPEQRYTLRFALGGAVAPDGADPPAD